MSKVDRAKVQVPVRQCIGVEYPDIKKCMSVSVTPEALRPNVQMGTIVSIGGGCAVKARSGGSMQTSWHWQ